MATELTTTIDIAKVLIRSGSNAERLISKTMQGEPAYITDSKRVIVGDGFTIGGYVLGNILYGIGGTTISSTASRLSSANSGFIYTGDTYFCNTSNTCYTLTGTSVSELSSYKQLMTITTGDDYSTVRNLSGTLSLLPLSADSLFTDIGRAGVTVDGIYLTLGSTISTNLITYLDYSNSPFYTAMKVEASALNYYRITTETLKFAPSSLNQLELPKYLTFGSAEVNVIQSNWNNQTNGLLYKNASSVIELSATPTSRLQFFEQPIDVVRQLGTLNGAFNIDFTTLSTSNVTSSTLSGFTATYTTILFSGTISNITDTDSMRIRYTLPNAVSIDVDWYVESTINLRSFYFLLPLRDPTSFKYSIGEVVINFNATGTPPVVTLSAIAAI